MHYTTWKYFKCIFYTVQLGKRSTEWNKQSEKENELAILLRMQVSLYTDCTIFLYRVNISVSHLFLLDSVHLMLAVCISGLTLVLREIPIFGWRRSSSDSKHACFSALAHRTFSSPQLKLTKNQSDFSTIGWRIPNNSNVSLQKKRWPSFSARSYIHNTNRKINQMISLWIS